MAEAGAREAKLQQVLQIATAEIGTIEKAGPEDNPRILEYLKTVRLVKVHDEVPWCAAFVNWVLARADLPGTGSTLARSFLKWGIPLKHPIPGCVVVLKRGGSTWQGHVAFFVRRVPGNLIKALGGNQSDCVKVSVYKESDVLGYRWLLEDQQ